MKVFFYTIAFLWIANAGVAQELIKKIPMQQIETLSTDEIGNVYVAGKNRSIIKYNKDGDSLLDFRIIKNGKIHTLDATNPLELYVIQPNFNRLTILDRMMSPKLELDISKLGILNSTAIGQSRDGNFWIFDNVNGVLKKVNPQLNIVLQSNDFRLEEGISLSPVHLEEKNERVVLSDPQNGIFVFDRYGSMIQHFDIKAVNQFQLVENMMIYFVQGELNIYNFEMKKYFTMPLPAIAEVLQTARIERERLYILTDKNLYIYFINT